MDEKLIEQFIDSFSILVIRYFLFCGLFFAVFYFIFKKPLARHKLQQSFPAKAEYFREILYSVAASFILGLVFTLTVLSPGTRIYNNIETYGWTYYWISYILMLLVHDTYFYWIHRLMHTPRLFKIIHLVHHKSINPSPWTSYAFHPLEAVLQALIMPVIAFLFPVQIGAFVIYFLFQFLHNIYGHLGYELLPAFIRNSSVGRLLNTSVIHNSHHKNVKGNYGLFFTVWDRMMGTLK